MKTKIEIKRMEARLKAYSTLAMGVIGLSTVADAQILYTDVHPDKVVGDTGSYYANPDNDLYSDFRIFQGKGSTAEMVGLELGADCEIMGSLKGNYFYPFALSLNDNIDGADTNWHANDFGTLFYNNGPGAQFGNWQNVIDKYIGVKLTIKGHDHFGWVRLDVSADAKKFVVKDMAYEFTYGKGISAGDALTTYAVTAIEAADVADNSNASDMQIKFNKAVDESKVKEYRIILIPTTDTLYVTPNLADTLSHGQYVKVAKTGSNILMNLPSNAKDIRGKLVKLGVSYRIYILSVPDGVNANIPILSTNDKQIALHVVSSPAGKPIAEDIGNNGNGSDIKISFPKAADESKVKHYKIFCVKVPKAITFDLVVAKSLEPSRFYQVDKTGSDLQFTLPASLKDSDGQLIKNDVPYKFFILSFADGTNASLNVLSVPSDVFSLVNTISIEEYNQNVKWVFNNNNLYFNFNQGINEPVQFSLYDLTGKAIITKSFYSNEEMVGLEMLPSGYYIFKLRADKLSIEGKIRKD